MDQVRIGVIGCGTMARKHMGYFGRIEGLKFTAAADLDRGAAAAVADKYGVRAFTSATDLMDSGLVDAVLIAVPHYFHPEFSIGAMRRGLHVLTEKPVAVTAKDAETVNRFHADHPHLVYAAMFNQRTNPCWKKVKQIIDSGELGAIMRVNWIITNWFRTQSYYDSAGWRGTWRGEGGGVLINQCPHNLDLLQWFAGMPTRITALVGIGKRHRIEVEDEVTAIMEYANGATGVFVTSTGEAPGTNRLEIAGESGRLITDGGTKIEFIRTDVPVTEFLNTAPGRSIPSTSKATIEVASDRPEHRGILQNFINAILHDEPLIAQGEEGIHGLELGNAMLMSGLRREPVPLPTDREAFASLIANLSETSTFQR